MGLNVQVSYEEQIINALGRVPHPRGQHFMERDKADFAAIRAVLQPLYDENERLRGQVAVARQALEYYSLSDGGSDKAVWSLAVKALAALEGTP